MEKRLLTVALAALFLAAPAVRAGEVTASLPGDVKIGADEEPFDEARHDLVGCHASYRNCRVDGVIAYGVTSELKTRLESLHITVGGKRYRLDTAGMYNPLLPKAGLEKRFGGFCYDENNCAFRGVFGDAGGTYSAEWVIQNGQAWRTLLSDQMDISQFFMAHLTPPRYD